MKLLCVMLWSGCLLAFEYLPEIGISGRHYSYPFHPHCYLLHELAPLKGEGISLGCNDTLAKEHGLFTRNLLKIIAPKLHIVFVQTGMSLQAYAQDLSTLSTYKTTILLVNLACKEPLDYTQSALQSIEYYLKNYEWVIAAAGNDQHSWATNGCAYPARSPCVTYSVGSYTSAGKISNFSQSNIIHMPSLVAPGELLNVNGVIKSGTSVSSALIAGFIALVLGEFGSFFTPQQLKTIIKYAIFKHDHIWEQSVTEGYIDFRMALYMMRILESVYSQTKVPGYSILLKHCIMLRSLLLSNCYEWFYSFCLLYPIKRLLAASYYHSSNLIQQDTAAFLNLLNNGNT